MYRVARFFWAKLTKNWENKPNEHKIMYQTVESIPNGHKIHQHFPFQGPPKFGFLVLK
jgi:hypothetical protein